VGLNPAAVALALRLVVRDNTTSGLFSLPLELNLAAVASRSSLVGALLRNANIVNRHILLDFLQGLSRDELECLAEFQGACVLEAEYSTSFNSYRLMSDFFDPAISERWRNPDDRAHKMFIVLGYLDHLETSITIRFHPKSFESA
jgi:hypothetical protein